MQPLGWRSINNDCLLPSFSLNLFFFSFLIPYPLPHLLSFLVPGSGTKPAGPSFGCATTQPNPQKYLFPQTLLFSPTAVFYALGEQAGNNANSKQREVRRVPEFWKNLQILF